ncbi:hypothetical protein GCM10007425_19630 [Lysinibacillus alkalisoli]|uniref:Competence protein ComFB n=1 Tax=Lysinibacillus alkalisoli TaxID=1911548 RepID=A0A917G6F3_9BACI|nr:late competence development ComFB family protein [Lysinibacillus alkalisoli]GGG25115.1 hypothetical protein GCM10007425_19630 [Lysinibacillus alkalisoli]
MATTMLVNVTEEIITGLVGFYLRGVEYQTFCHCEHCETKIIAAVLNELPSYYVTNEADRNEAFAKLNTEDQVERMNRTIIHAIHTIGQKPNHQ